MKLFSAFTLLCLLLFQACHQEPQAKETSPVVVTKSAEALENQMTGLPEDTLRLAAEVDSTTVVADKELIEEKKTEDAPTKSVKKSKRSKKQAKIEFKEEVFSFGKIQQGEKVEHQFKFKNTGKADLIIKDARASCGCTQPSFPFIPIGPGEEGYIGVIFNSEGRLGNQQATITLVTNASPTTYKLKLEGLVDDDTKDPEG